MKLTATLLAAAAMIATAGTANAAYTPTGVQTNVALSTVTSGGWTLCYSSSMGTSFGSSAAATLANCTGSSLMLAGRLTGSQNLLVLAQAPKVDALFNTGAGDNGVFHNANGADWFYADNWSWGFKETGSAFRKFQCSFSAPALSMCVHTLSGVGGYSIGATTGLNSSSAYEKLVFSQNLGAVPEPATWGLMILGMAAVGAGLRRRSTKVAFAA